MIAFKQSDLAELKDPCSYVSDVIIEFFFTYLSSVHPSDSILYVPPSISFLLSNSTDDGFVEDCLKSLELPSKKLIFFTVYRCKHWSLLVYHRESNRFVHHDSSIAGVNDDAARELYLSVKDCVHENGHRIKPRTRRYMDDPRYVGSQMWPEENDYERGSYGFPLMQHMDDPYDDPRNSMVWQERHIDGPSDDPRYVRSRMWRERKDYDHGSHRVARMRREKNEYEDDCGLYEGPQMLLEKNDYDDSRFSDDKDCGLYDAFDSGSYISSEMQREKDDYDCGLQPQMQRENNVLFICPKTPQQKNGFDCGLYVMSIAEAICRWFCEEDEEKSWIEKISVMVDDSSISSMRTRVLELIRDASSGGLGTVSCTIEEETSVGECSNHSDASRGLEHGVVTVGGNKEETDGVDDNFWKDIVTIERNKEETDGGDVNFWEDIDWSTDEDDYGTISDGDDCETISEGLTELMVEEGEKDCRTLCESPPPSIAVGKMVGDDRDSVPLMEEENANAKVSAEVRSLAREEAVDGSGMVEPSLSCDLTSDSHDYVKNECQESKLALVLIDAGAIANNSGNDCVHTMLCNFDVPWLVPLLFTDWIALVLQMCHTGNVYTV